LVISFPPGVWRLSNFYTRRLIVEECRLRG
jgi:hypothetical protein